MVRRYLAAVAFGNFAWELAQMPLYTLWRTGSPGEIAFAVGFQSLTHFNHTFKRIVGQSPTQYRRQGAAA